jgi:hypothetical protein
VELQETSALMAREKRKRRKPRGESTDAEHWDGPISKSDEGSVMGLEQRDRVRRSYGRNNWKQEDDDAYDGQIVQDHQEASVRYKAVKSNHGAAGVEKEETIEQFEADLKGNLYKLWIDELGKLLSAAGARRLHTQEGWR